MSFTLAQLKSELQTDPTALGYNSAARNDTDMAAKINLPRVSISIRRTDVSPSEIWSAINTADMIAIPAAPTATQLSTERRQLTWLQGIAAIPTLRLINDDGTDTVIITMAKSIFTAGSATLTRLNALSNRNGSRAEQLFGRDTIVAVSDISAAMNS